MCTNRWNLQENHNREMAWVGRYDKIGKPRIPNKNQTRSAKERSIMTNCHVIEEVRQFARSEERIRAVTLHGSRVNPNAPKDPLMDYDVACFVDDPSGAYYKTNQTWIESFGRLVIMQQNDFEEGYIFLMQFTDGVRIDMSFISIRHARTHIESDTLTKVLLDKEGLLGWVPDPSDRGYYVQMPTKKAFVSLMNELWWIQPYIAKGLWRGELPYAKHMFDSILIDCVRTLLEWYIGMNSDWKTNPGKCSKWFYRFLPKKIYEEFLSLYPSIHPAEIWAALFQTGPFARKIGMELAQRLGYPYPVEDEQNVTRYLKEIQRSAKA